MSNFNSFSPNAGLGGQVFNMVEGDQYEGLRITLKESNCLTDEDDWDLIDLETVHTVTLHFREHGTTSLIASIPCTVVAATDTVWLEWPPGVLDDLEGSYEGEIEVVYMDTSIVTIFDILNFNIRKDFSN